MHTLRSFGTLQHHIDSLQAWKIVSSSKSLPLGNSFQETSTKQTSFLFHQSSPDCSIIIGMNTKATAYNYADQTSKREEAKSEEQPELYQVNFDDDDNNNMIMHSHEEW